MSDPAAIAAWKRRWGDPRGAWRSLASRFRATPRIAEASSSECWLRWLLGLAVALPLLLCVALGSYLYRASQVEALKRIERIVLASEAHAARLLDTNVMLLGRVMDMVEDLPDAAIRQREPELNRRMQAITTGLPQVVSLWLLDARGRPLATDRFPIAQAGALDLAGRDSFAWHRDGGRGLYISEPGVAGVPESRLIDTSVAREVGGRFAGTVHASLEQGFFSRFYSALAREEPTLDLSLFRSDGVLLARYPDPGEGVHRMPPTNLLMQRFHAGEAQGAAVLRSSIDGVERLVAFRGVESYPLYVSAGIETAFLAATWWREIAMIAALMLPLSAALVVPAWVALRRARREHEALVRMRSEVEHRLKAEGALLRAQKLQALGQITGSVAHDFNNLLAVVSNSAHLIMRRGAGADPMPQAIAIERAVRNGVHLTRQLLAFSRRQALHPEQVDLQQALPGTIALLRTGVSGRVQVELCVESGVAPVCIDPADLELALLNLVLNARDAMPEGGMVTVRARNLPAVQGGTDMRATADGQWVEISVADNGTGIAAPLLDRVFEPFFTTKDQTNGTGLGLYQVRTAFEQAGGSVDVDSVPGIGTTIRLLLPAMRDPLPPEACEQAPHLSCAVLLVEDDGQVGDTTAALLVSMGARVERVGHAADALRYLAEAASSPDVVLTDVAMPGALNGLGLAQQLRRTRPELGIVLMTGFTNEFGIAMADRFTVVSKPFDPGRLASLIMQECREAEARKAQIPPGAGA
jgi:signal transduction histidine kinase/CheY-like chemotaxis protein